MTPSNVAPFVYLRGILQQPQPQTQSALSLPLNSFDLDAFMLSLLPNSLLDPQQGNTSARLPVPVLEYLLDVRAETPQRNTIQQDQITRLLTLLAAQDPIRKGWWDFKRSELLVPVPS